MKKLLILFTVAILGLGLAWASDKYSRDVKTLPKPAQTMLAKYFPGTAVHHIKIDKNLFGDRDYDVTLTDGTEVEFDHKGRWTEVDCGHQQVPSALILPAISNYLSKNHPGAYVVQVKIERNRYEVELNNDYEITFDSEGNYLKTER